MCEQEGSETTVPERCKLGTTDTWRHTHRKILSACVSVCLCVCVGGGQYVLFVSETIGGGGTQLSVTDDASPHP